MMLELLRKLSHRLPGSPDISRSVWAGEPQALSLLLEIMGKGLAMMC